jgi:hypothetical protein
MVQTNSYAVTLEDLLVIVHRVEIEGTNLSEVGALVELLNGDEVVGHDDDAVDAAWGAAATKLRTQFPFLFKLNLPDEVAENVLVVLRERYGALFAVHIQ